MDQEGSQGISQGESCFDVNIMPNNEQLKLGFYCEKY